MSTGKKVILSVISLLAILSMTWGGYLIGNEGMLSSGPVADGPTAVFIAGKVSPFWSLLLIGVGVVLLAGVFLTACRSKK